METIQLRVSIMAWEIVLVFSSNSEQVLLTPQRAIIYWKLTKETLEQGVKYAQHIFHFFNFEYIPNLALVFLLLTLTR